MRACAVDKHKKLQELVHAVAEQKKVVDNEREAAQARYKDEHQRLKHMQQQTLFLYAQLKVEAEVQADCTCIMYLCVPVCVIEGRGAISTLGLKAPLVSKVQPYEDKTCFQLEPWFSELAPLR